MGSFNIISVYCFIPIALPTTPMGVCNTFNSLYSFLEPLGNLPSVRHCFIVSFSLCIGLG